MPNVYLASLRLSFKRETKENNSLLKEETEGLRRKLERLEKVMEEKIKVELEKEVTGCKMCS